MSNYNPNPLLGNYNESLDNISNANRNKNQAANIVSNFMSQQPDRVSEDTDFAKIQAIYNNYQSTNKPSDLEGLNSIEERDETIPTTINQPKKSWFNFGNKKTENKTITESFVVNSPTIRKISWKNRLTWLLGFCLIIGGIGWYLILIQPTGLEVIYSANQSKVNNLNVNYKNTSTDLANYIKELDKFTNTAVTNNCATQSSIEDEAITRTSMDKYLNDKLVINTDSMEYTKESNILTYKYFDNNFDNIVISYSDSLKTLKQSLESISYIPELVNYKNQFIEGCQLFANKGFNIETINQFCDDLTPKSDSTIKFFTSIEIPTNSKLSTSVAKSIQGCNEKPQLGTNGRIARDSVTLATWQQQFNLNYDEFIGRRVQIDTIIKNIQSTDIEFDQEVVKVRNSNQKEFDRKKSGFPNYYILQPNTKAIAKRLPI